MDNDNELTLGMAKNPECAFNNPVSAMTFKDLVNSAPPGPRRERLTRHVAKLMTEGVDCLTTNNGDGTFSHEFFPRDPDWPHVVE